MPPRKMNIGAKAITKLEVVERYSWYIDHAFQFRKREIEKQLASARQTLEQGQARVDIAAPDDRAQQSLASLISELECIQREFNQAHDALIAAGVK